MRGTEMLARSAIHPAEAFLAPKPIARHILTIWCQNNIEIGQYLTELVMH